ncbi:hypothetical protein BO78DRAFT_444560 [Aspergillus sclerotiicarbonarius CBS 121057]|uniref:Uncharacterized protein n=1 Tax=Aspergillus sclerotiicarbonarius (strain CBS 121057 / IBT 28362) TaxID=1448318 RepID=A0A319EH58_ASPSB|nr:hypothetical protein BO78DRAFT_444560 [Aspergillus sclerotiicarbonarius CBS 121057]
MNGSNISDPRCCRAFFSSTLPGMTSRYLRQNRPCLFQAIETVTTLSTQQGLFEVEQLSIFCSHPPYSAYSQISTCYVEY